MKFDWVFQGLTPLQKWRVTVGLFVVGLVAFDMWALGKIPLPGEHGFAQSSQVKQEVSKQVEPIRQEVSEVKKQATEANDKITVIGTTLNTVLADVYEKRVKEGIRERCRTPLSNVAARTRINDQIDRDRKEYRKYSGEDFPPKTCDEV